MRRSSALLWFLLLIVSAVATAQQVTIEKLMSAPFPSGLSASPDGAKFAWIQNDKGLRSIWIAEPPDYRGRQLLRYPKDDGQELSSLRWTPDAKTIVYVRGGRPNRQQEIPNPTSDPAGQLQVIWTIPVQGGEPVKLGEGHSPAPSPRGDGVAFVQKEAIHWVPIDGSKPSAKLVGVRGTPQDLRWSPDGSKLAFVSSRSDHNFIAIYDSTEKTIRFLDPTVDRDRSPVWSPDSSRIAFIRIPADTDAASFRPEREAEPWSIAVADLASGTAKTIWRADKGVGSAFWPVVAEDQLVWGANDQIVFPWEKDGWVHLYAIDAKGGAARLLTPGTFEVEFATATPDRRFIVYNSNQGDIDRRHLWRVAVAGGTPEQLTKSQGIEWAPHVSSDGRAIAHLRSDARRPAHAAILISGQSRELVAGWMPSEFPIDVIVEPQQVIFAASDGMPIHAQLVLPRNAKPGGKHPAAIFFHGGSRRQMLLGWNYSPYYHNAYAFNQYLASRGYVVLSVNYRSGIGYGMEFREALGYGAKGASEFHDVLGAGLYLRNRPDVDPDRIGLWGGSYGGYLTALGLARASDLFAAGVDIHGVHDWNIVIRNFTPDYDPVKRTEDARLAFSASPMASLETWRSPVLVIHGDDDRNVPFSETVRLVEALRKKGVEVEQRVYPDEVHSFLLHTRWLETYRLAADFFDRKLKGR